MSNYYAVCNMTVKQKYEEYLNPLNKSKDSFQSLIETDKERKENNEIFKYKEKVLDNLSVKFKETNPEKIFRTSSGKRKAEKTVAKIILQMNEDTLKNNQRICQDFPVRMDDYVQYLQEKKLKSIEEFLNNHTEKEIYNFMVKHFGCDFACNEYHTYLEEEDLWRHDEYHINFGKLVNHLIGYNILKTKRYRHSKVVTIEIQNDTEKMNFFHYLTLSDMATIVKQELGAEPFYVERSIEANGIYRMYFLFDNYLSIDNKKRLELYFENNYSFKIEIQKNDDFRNLPFSRETELTGKFDQNHILHVKSETLNETYERLNKEDKQICKTNFLRSIIGSTHEGQVIECSYELDEGLALMSTFNSGPDQFSYGLGTRFKNQSSLAVWCCGKELPFEEYVSLAYSLNVGGSKDMKNWSAERINKELKKYYNFGQKVANPHSDYIGERPSYLMDNGKKSYIILDMENQTSLNTKYIKDIFLEIIEYNYNLKYPKQKQQGLWKTYFLQDTLSLYRFLERKKEYDIKRKKVYKNERFKELEKGVILPVSMYKDLKKKLKIKTSISKMIAFLIDIGLLQEIQIEGHTYSYKNQIFAKHYKLFNEKLLREILLKMKKLYYKNLIYNNNIYKYYNINNKIIKKASFFGDISYASYFHFQGNFGNQKIAKFITKLKPPQIKNKILN